MASFMATTTSRLATTRRGDHTHLDHSTRLVLTTGRLRGGARWPLGERTATRLCDGSSVRHTSTTTQWQGTAHRVPSPDTLTTSPLPATAGCTGRRRRPLLFTVSPHGEMCAAGRLHCLVVALCHSSTLHARVHITPRRRWCLPCAARTPLPRTPRISRRAACWAHTQPRIMQRRGAVHPLLLARALQHGQWLGQGALLRGRAPRHGRVLLVRRRVSIRGAAHRRACATRLLLSHPPVREKCSGVSCSSLEFR